MVWDLCAELLSGFTSAGKTNWNTSTHTHTHAHAFINVRFQALATVKVIYSITSHKLISINTEMRTHVRCAGLRQICEEMRQNKECRFTAG